MRILIIEDSRPQGISTQYALASEGIESDYAESNGEALSFLYSGKSYDAIIQDMNRPSDGIIPRSSSAEAGEQFFEHFLQTICPGMPIIILTGYEKEACFGGRLPTQCTYVSKQAPRVELITAVRVAVASASSRS